MGGGHTKNRTEAFHNDVRASLAGSPRGGLPFHRKRKELNMGLGCLPDSPKLGFRVRVRVRLSVSANRDRTGIGGDVIVRLHFHCYLQLLLIHIHSLGAIGRRAAALAAEVLQR